LEFRDIFSEFINRKPKQISEKKNISEIKDLFSFSQANLELEREREREREKKKFPKNSMNNFKCSDRIFEKSEERCSNSNECRAT